MLPDWKHLLRLAMLETILRLPACSGRRRTGIVIASPTKKDGIESRP